MEDVELDTKAETIITRAANELFSLDIPPAEVAKIFGFYAVTMMIDNEGTDAAQDLLKELQENIAEIAPLLNK